MQSNHIEVVDDERFNSHNEGSDRELLELQGSQSGPELSNDEAWEFSSNETASQGHLGSSVLFEGSGLHVGGFSSDEDDMREDELRDLNTCGLSATFERVSASFSVPESRFQRTRRLLGSAESSFESPLRSHSIRWKNSRSSLKMYPIWDEVTSFKPVKLISLTTMGIPHREKRLAGLLLASGVCSGFSCGIAFCHGILIHALAYMNLNFYLAMSPGTILLTFCCLPNNIVLSLVGYFALRSVSLVQLMLFLSLAMIQVTSVISLAIMTQFQSFSFFGSYIASMTCLLLILLFVLLSSGLVPFVFIHLSIDRHKSMYLRLLTSRTQYVSSEKLILYWLERFHS